MTLVTRFAPSPTGHLHLGHALSAIIGARQAALSAGRFLLRIEDLDRERCRPEYEVAIYDDLAWLQLEWELPVRRQSDHTGVYEEALQALKAMGLVYPCFCSRREVAAAIEANPEAEEGPDGPHYPGTCRDLPIGLAADRIADGELPAWRLNARKAMDKTGTLKWSDYAAGVVPVEARDVGDVLLGRREGPPAYHLSVVVDDHIQGITLVTRGMDLFGATGIHRILQALLGYKTPDYLHHRLIIDPATGHKLSKRDGSLSLTAMRESGMDAAEIIRLALSQA